MIGYRILFVDEAETQPKLNVSVGANISSIELTGLLVYTNYCIQVLAFNSQQDGNASDCVFALTDEDGKNKKSSEDSYVREAIYPGKILNYRESKCVSTAQNDLKKKKSRTKIHGRTTSDCQTQKNINFQCPHLTLSPN